MKKNPFIFALSIKISVQFFNKIGHYFHSSTYDLKLVFITKSEDFIPMKSSLFLYVKVQKYSDARIILSLETECPLNNLNIKFNNS